jgi:hypothetical protein
MTKCRLDSIRYPVRPVVCSCLISSSLSKCPLVSFSQSPYETPSLTIARGLRRLAFSFHPAIQQVLLESPAVPQLEGRNAPLSQIFVQRIWSNPQILGCLAQCHHFLQSFHILQCLFLTTGVIFGLLSNCLPRFPETNPNSHDILRPKKKPDCTRRHRRRHRHLEWMLGQEVSNIDAIMARPYFSVPLAPFPFDKSSAER